MSLANKLLQLATLYPKVQVIGQGVDIEIDDTNSTHKMTIRCGSDLTNDRILTLTTGDANRILTMSADAALNQDVTSTSSPTFAKTTTVLKSKYTTISGANITINADSYDTYHVTGDATITTISNMSNGQTLVFSTEGNSITFSGPTIYWKGGSAFSHTVGGKDILTLYMSNSKIYGSFGSAYATV